MEKDKSLASSTKTVHETTLKKLQDYRPDTTFADLTLAWVQQFDNFLRESGLATNTVKGHHKRVGRYIRLAITKELYKGADPYMHFRKKEEPARKVILSTYEVGRIEALELRAAPYLERIRDLFLFCCWTGLRAKDAATLRFCDIHRSRDGYKLDISADKTKKQMLLPLYKLYNGKPEQLIQKYEHRSGARPNSKQTVFAKASNGITNQYLNRQLKRIAQMAEISKRLSSHVGRYTFSTDMATRVPALILKDLLQHKNLKTTMGYVGLSQKAINDALDNIDW